MLDARPVEHHTPSESINAVRIAVELLRGSLEYLHIDRGTATQLISRACAVLESVIVVAPAAPAIRGGLAPWQIRKLEAYIDANIGMRVTVEHLAALVRLAPGYFPRAFKRSFGVSPHAFLMDRRIRRAQTLMLTTHESLGAIAIATGFADQAHLTTRFSRVVGLTPSAWRRLASSDAPATLLTTDDDVADDFPDHGA